MQTLQLCTAASMDADYVNVMESQPGELFKLVSELLEKANGNGEISLKDRDLILLAVLKDQMAAQLNLAEKVEKLLQLEKDVQEMKKKILVNWIQAHPKLAGLILIVLFVMINAWFVSDFRKPLLSLLGLPADLIP